VLQLLKEGKTSRSIANQFGVSRQAIDLYRKEFIQTGLMQRASGPLPVTTPQLPTPEVSTKPTVPITPHDVSLDQVIELMIKALVALKRIPELEAEVEKYRRDYTVLLKLNEQLEESEKKRKEQEERWLQAQNPHDLIS
jgi:hypothetical protein